MDKQEVKNLLSKVSDEKLINMVLQDRDEYDKSTLAAAIEVLNERDVEIKFDRYREKKNKITVNPDKMNIEKTAEPADNNEQQLKTSIKNIKVKPKRKETTEESKEQQDISSETEKTKSEISETTDDNEVDNEVDNEKIDQGQSLESFGQLELDKKGEVNTSAEETSASKQDKLEFSEQEILEIQKARDKPDGVDNADTKVANHGKISDLLSYTKLGVISLFFALSMLLVFSFAALVATSFGLSPVLLIVLFLIFFVVSILAVYKSFYLFSDVNQEYKKINNFLEKSIAEN